MNKKNNVGASIARPLRSNKNGITLIALVITIIVLLILAGITISLTLGQDGIITKAGKAGKTYQNAEAEEKVKLGDLEASITAGKVARTENGVQYVGDGMGNLIPVPIGFSYLEGNKNTGFVIKNDTDNNEFVWIPCTIDGANGSIKYDRYAFAREGWNNSQTLNTTTGEIKRANVANYVWTETMPNDEYTSIEKYKGFYIGRYESGVEGYSGLSTTKDGTTTWTGYSNGTLVIQKEKQVWNYITRDRAKLESEKLYNKTKGDSANSKLCSSYAWDTALKFIETKYPTYPTNSTVGNYKDKAATLGKPALTGKTETVNNIYDMGGNVYEWTTEVSSYTSPTCTIRGGYYISSASYAPAAYRDYHSTTNAYDGVGFRSTLYL